MRDSYYRGLPAKKSHFAGFLKLLIKNKLLTWQRGAIRVDGTREFNTYWPTYNFFRSIDLTYRHRAAAKRLGLAQSNSIHFEQLNASHRYIVQKGGKNSVPYPNKKEDCKALKASARLLAKHRYSIGSQFYPAPKLQRIFGEEIETHGRIYPRGFQYQSVRRKQRKYIRIDGEAVTELDFGSTIPSLAFLAAKEMPPLDAYTLEPFCNYENHASYRYLFKKFINIMLNTASLRGATEACYNALPDIFDDLKCVFR